MNTAASNKAALVDVVFVHGLGGGDPSTWTARKATDSWLEWLAHDIPSAAIWSLQYPAGATKWTTAGEGMALPDRAKGLISRLLYHGIGSRKTVFVCHSLGGLVVKQVLRYSIEMQMRDWRAIAGSTLGVVFLATPHSGSSLANLAKAIPLSRPTKTTLALAAHCPHLQDLGDWYRQNAQVLGIETLAYSESRKVRRGVRLVTVVNPTSANPGIDGCITTPVDADHISICKPATRNDDPYQGVETFVKRQIERIGELQPNGTALIDLAHFDESLATSSVILPEDLVTKVRQVLLMGELNLLEPFEVQELKMGILNRHYGVGND